MDFQGNKSFVVGGCFRPSQKERLPTASTFRRELLVSGTFVTPMGHLKMLHDKNSATANASNVDSKFYF